MAIVAAVVLLLLVCLGAAAVAWFWAAWRQVDSAGPVGSRGGVKVEVESAGYANSRDYRVRLTVTNTLPLSEQDAEMYVSEGDFELEDNAGHALQFSRVDLDYRGDRDYIWPGEDMRITLVFRGRSQPKNGFTPPAGLVYESVYSGGPIRLRFASC